MSALRVCELVGLATVQDPAGRPGWRAHGLPPGGALVPAWLEAANAAVGNPPGAAGLELSGRLGLEALRPVVLCAAGRRRRLAAGERLRLEGPAPAAVAYVAVAGGVQVGRAFGGRGALPGAPLPGLLGRALRLGDELDVGDAAGPLVAVASPVLDPRAPLRWVPGPDLDAFAADALARLELGPWIVAAAGRAGVRLAGPPLPRRDADLRRSAPVVRGAIQVPGDGQPLVLGPDGPTIGGYPVLATLLRADAEALAARPPGAPVVLVRAPAALSR